MTFDEKLQSDYYRNKINDGYTRPRGPVGSPERGEIHRKNRELEGAVAAEFKKDLFEEYGVENNPKADKAYSIAYDHGHSGGYNEVAGYFGELVELIR